MKNILSVSITFLLCWNLNAQCEDAKQDILSTILLTDSICSNEPGEIQLTKDLIGNNNIQELLVNGVGVYENLRYYLFNLDSTKLSEGDTAKIRFEYTHRCGFQLDTTYSIPITNCKPCAEHSFEIPRLYHQQAKEDGIYLGSIGENGLLSINTFNNLIINRNDSLFLQGSVSFRDRLFFNYEFISNCSADTLTQYFNNQLIWSEVCTEFDFIKTEIKRELILPTVFCNQYELEYPFFHYFNDYIQMHYFTFDGLIISTPGHTQSLHFDYIDWSQTNYSPGDTALINIAWHDACGDLSDTLIRIPVVNCSDPCNTLPEVYTFIKDTVRYCQNDVVNLSPVQYPDRLWIRGDHIDYPSNFSLTLEEYEEFADDTLEVSYFFKNQCGIPTEMVRKIFIDGSCRIDGLRNKNTNHSDVFPNPFDGFIQLQNTADLVQIRLFNVTGELILETSDQTIKTSNLTKGLYILEAQYGDGTSTQQQIIKN